MREERRFSRGARRFVTSVSARTSSYQLVPARTSSYQLVNTVYPYNCRVRTFGWYRIGTLVRTRYGISSTPTRARPAARCAPRADSRTTGRGRLNDRATVDAGASARAAHVGRRCARRRRRRARRDRRRRRARGRRGRRGRTRGRGARETWDARARRCGDWDGRAR